MNKKSIRLTPIKYLVIGFVTFLSITIGLFGVQPFETIAQTQDPIIYWNAIALATIRDTNTSPQIAARNLAMMHAAIYDAVNAISPTHSVYQVKIQAAKDANPEAAAVSAAHQVLSQLYPQQATQFNNALEASLGAIAQGQPKTKGIELGKVVAEKILAWRKNDGSATELAYTPPDKPGYWQPVPPEFKSASMPHWKNLKPFVMKEASQFRISQMPSLNSAEYTAEFEQTKAIGAKNSTTRTEDQTAIAQFWLDGKGTITPPGHWNQIAADLAVRQGNTLPENARLFALLNIALVDATIIDSDHKYTFNRWRPITAIQKADTDDNSQTTAEPNWTPLLDTPASPAYVSGHSTLGGAADAILTAYFGKNVNFKTAADPKTNLSARSFDSFTQAAEEAGMSRVYGGAHWLSDNRDGLAAGRNLGNYAVQNFLRPL
ncbi:vanadium-dependent haloperoxidase [Candidatus Gracilibacteria bacterium]|nr:vanadium-dependent haloperoxidase [Candidatus Gracilibacteria bacterium]NJP18774.1 vanadium-dependent haloperoxidase [Hydrococcus sp. CRU_1_1]NJQ98112.1 vanadium-dependent haloperoxidase [Hydrococcus sp. CSU_1_8]